MMFTARERAAIRVDAILTGVVGLEVFGEAVQEEARNIIASLREEDDPDDDAEAREAWGDLWDAVLRIMNAVEPLASGEKR